MCADHAELLKSYQKTHLGRVEDQMPVFELGLPDPMLQFDFVEEHVQTLAAKRLRFDNFFEQLLEVLCQGLRSDRMVVVDSLSQLCQQVFPNRRTERTTGIGRGHSTHG